MIKSNTHQHYRAIRCSITIHRFNLIEAFKTWHDWQNGICQLYDADGFIA